MLWVVGRNLHLLRRTALAMGIGGVKLRRSDGVRDPWINQDP